MTFALYAFRKHFRFWAVADRYSLVAKQITCNC